MKFKKTVVALLLDKYTRVVVLLSLYRLKISTFRLVEVSRACYGIVDREDSISVLLLLSIVVLFGSNNCDGAWI